MISLKPLAATIVLATAGLLAVAAAPARPAPAAADASKVDPVHSSVVFRIRHNTAPFYGRFNQVSGSFQLDAADPAKSSLDVSVKSASVDSNNPKRDDHLKSQSFFSVSEFPTITFKGKQFKKVSGNSWEVTGDLTLRGVTKAVTVAVEDTSDGKGGGLEAKFTIKRSDFGMNFMVDKGLGDDVSLMIGLEAGK